MTLQTWDKKAMYDMETMTKAGINLKDILTTPITAGSCRIFRCKNYTSNCKYFFGNQCLKQYITKGEINE